MKYRILINSKHNSEISNFFKTTSQAFDCLSTSECLDDIANHFKLFRPEAYVCFNEGTQCGSLMTQMRALKSSHDFSMIPIVVIGNEAACSMLSKLQQKPDLILRSDAPVETIISEISRVITSSKKDSPQSSGQRPDQRVQTPISVISRPKAAGATKAPEPVKPAVSAVQEPEVKSTVKPNLLVIDDDKNILRLIKSACSDNFNITTMLNADLIDKYFESKTVDLILLDYEMPGENGPQVFQRLRKIPNACETPIVFLTGVSDRSKIQEVLSLKPQGYVLKPINMEKLFSTIYSLIR